MRDSENDLHALREWGREDGYISGGVYEDCGKLYTPSRRHV